MLWPRIYLPACIEEQDRPYIVAHEQAHIARGDHWWKLLGFICLCLHWYNPMVWISFVLFGRDTEMACDERVVWGMELESRKAYSLALLNSGRQLSGLAALTLCFGKESLKQRIKSVLSFRKPGMKSQMMTGIKRIAETKSGFEPLKDNLEDWINNKIKDRISGLLFCAFSYHFVNFVP